MEIRKRKVMINKAGGTAGENSVNYRVSLPAPWIQRMKIDIDNRDLKLEFDGDRIIITNNVEEVKLLNKILDAAKDEISIEMNRVGFIDESDNSERFIDELAYKFAEEYEDEELDFDEVLEMLDDYMKKTYRRKGGCNDRGDYTGCYYKDREGLKKWSEFGE